MSVIEIVIFFPRSSLKEAGHIKIEGEGNLTSEKRKSFTLFLLRLYFHQVEQPVWLQSYRDSPELKSQKQLG